MATYNPTATEQDVQKLWDEEQIYQHIKNIRSSGKPFYFLDGPPYTSGKVHLGTAWNKSLKDMVLRYKRMCGYNVWDRAGYDMHGLPTEQATERKLGLQGKEAIESFGVQKFIEACKALCVENMEAMNEDFKRLGVWMDFKNAYQSISPEFIDGEWWLIKKAHEQGRLYRGLRTMTWCPITASAIAKHELEYKNVTDTSIFVKFKVSGTENEYLVVWTTTPWTIPLNLAIMVNPELEYVKAQVDDEVWILSKALGAMVIQSIVGKPYKELDVFTGDTLEGMKYEHFFKNDMDFKEVATQAKQPEKLHTVLLSREHVDTSAGTGLVHCAPGCGPEDYEVGHRNGLPPFNTVDVNGYFAGSGSFDGLRARWDDKKFITAIEKAGHLVGTSEVEHEYPHSERTHEPVIFRTTEQWFFKVEDIKEAMITENNKITWVPQTAYNAFNSWLQNLRDNSISKQRYWGTPLPIWVNENNPDDILVIGSTKELEVLSGQKVADQHIPAIDTIVIKKDGKTYRRVPDILDVWVDAGTASWNCIDYPRRTDLFDSMFPAEFILEGKDQIRGWFNLLHVASMVSMKRPSFKNVYMHGFVQDSQGRKMSKSLGNYILPSEVIEKYGADTFRYYFIGGANPGLDINYNPEDVELKHKHLHVLWNVHKFIKDFFVHNNLDYQQLLIDYASNDSKKRSQLSAEDNYMLAVLHSSIQRITTAFENYHLHEVPLAVEHLFLTLSRGYIQLIREKAVQGTEEEKEAIGYVLGTAIETILKLFSPVAPFITEAMYQQLREVLHTTEPSVHACEWVHADGKHINMQLIADMEAAEVVMQGILFAREKAQRGVRWPVKSAIVQTTHTPTIAALEHLDDLIMQQTNVKHISVQEKVAGISVTIKPIYGKLAKICGEKTQQAAQHITKHEQEIVQALDAKGTYSVVLDEKEITITKDCLEYAYVTPPHIHAAPFREGMIFIDSTLTPELEAEGYTRELIRRIQSARKDAGLTRKDTIELYLQLPEDLVEMIAQHEKQIKTITGTVGIMMGVATPEKTYPHTAKATIKGKNCIMYFSTISP